MKNIAMLSMVLGGLVACSQDAPDAAAGTGADAPANTEQVTGTLMYRERIFLPPGVVAEVWLLDTSLADAPAKEIAYQRIDDPGTPSGTSGDWWPARARGVCSRSRMSTPTG